MNRGKNNWLAKLAKSFGKDTLRNDKIEIFKAIRKLFSPWWTPEYMKMFREAESEGLHVTPAHFYSPVPNLSDLEKYNFEAWQTPGIEWRGQDQLSLLQELSEFAPELMDIPFEPDLASPHKFHWNNGAFLWYDACFYYTLIRKNKPKYIIEIGGGFSTLLSSLALSKNDRGSIVCIEPYPREEIKLPLPYLDRLIEKSVLNVDENEFKALGENDILFYDGSHVCKTGSDVNHVILQILPIINPGVWIHIHDIFLPLEFSRKWIMDFGLFWNEQYLLQAFLAFNDKFKIRFGNSYMIQNYEAVMRKSFGMDKLPTPKPELTYQGLGNSLWIQKIK